MPAAVTTKARRTRARALRASAESTANRVRLLRDGAAAFPAMLSAIAEAQREILLEMYWFASDTTGRLFADALAERARDGLDVRITYDSVGSFEASETMFNAMRAAGCQVHEFNPVAPWRKNFKAERINRRNHRKLLIVDGRLGITGGINLGNPWAPLEQGGGGFRDDAIEVVGAAARELRGVFFRNFPRSPSLLPSDLLDLPNTYCPVTVLAGDQAPERRGIRQGYLDAIRTSRDDIIICNSYFIPDRPTRAALYDARERGVRVRVLMPHQSDVRAAQLASRSLYEKLMGHGLELYEWRRSVLHSKTAVVDEHWCTVGSFNFDSLSFHNNLEINLAVHDRTTTLELRESLERDLAESVPIDLPTFRKRGLQERLLERACYALRWGL